MADIFVSYTSQDKQWAEWIGQRLLELGHIPHLHDWELVTDISAWMEERHDKADAGFVRRFGEVSQGPLLELGAAGGPMGGAVGPVEFLALGLD